MKFSLLGLAGGFLLLFLFINFVVSSRAEQSISFNHKNHQDQGVGCITCHPYFNEYAFSGMPDLNICLECNKEPVTKSPEEEKIRRFQKKGEQIPWRRLYEEPDHVYFSHRAHIVIGKIECKTCHGNIGESQRPPTKPFVQMTMSWCMNCHGRNKVTN